MDKDPLPLPSMMKGEKYLNSKFHVGMLRDTRMITLQTGFGWYCVDTQPLHVCESFSHPGYIYKGKLIGNLPNLWTPRTREYKPKEHQSSGLDCKHSWGTAPAIAVITLLTPLTLLGTSSIPGTENIASLHILNEFILKKKKTEPQKDCDSLMATNLGREQKTSVSVSSDSEYHSLI